MGLHPFGLVASLVALGAGAVAWGLWRCWRLWGAWRFGAAGEGGASRRAWEGARWECEGRCAIEEGEDGEARTWAAADIRVNNLGARVFVD